MARLLATLSQDPNWNGGDYYDRGDVLETMTQIRIATLKNYGIETRLRDTHVGSASNRGGDPRRGRAMGKRVRRQFADRCWRRRCGASTSPRNSANIKSKVLYVLSRTDKLFPPELAPGVMQALKAAGVDADYFLLDSEYGHSASSRDAKKWSPRLRQFMDGLN